MKPLFIRLGLVLALGFMCSPISRAQDLGAIKQSMEARISKLDAHKSSGAVGENNQGLVEVRDVQGDAAAVVTAENADRQVVYEAIARKTGTSAASVGAARAKQIAAGSKAGVWVQKEDGSWAKK